MSRTVIKTPNAPEAIGPYSQAIVANGFVFASGQIGLDPKTGTLVEGGVKKEAVRALENLDAVLKASGASWNTVVRATIYLKSMADFAVVNETYAAFVGSAPPARATVEVAGLPKGAVVEIDAIALVSAPGAGSGTA